MFYAHSLKNQPQAMWQPLADHLHNVAARTGEFAAKVGLPLAGQLIGLMHDLGKYSPEFQHYILSAGGILTPEHPNYINPVTAKGKIDHSTAGAQHIWSYLARNDKHKPMAQLLSLCILSHHSGLIDCITPEKYNAFGKRLGKAIEKTHLEVCRELIDKTVNETLRSLLLSGIMKETYDVMQSLHNHVIDLHQQYKSTQDDSGNTIDFQYGLLARFLLSCLLDADRIDSAEFEDPEWKRKRSQIPYRPWDRLVLRMEMHLKNFEQKHTIDVLRKNISDQCAQRATDPKGIFTLTVPTGGGKTLASLRFALRHAQAHNLDRIIYVIPYTSIIDQNAKVTRKILERDEEPGSIVLEHHSNVLPEAENTENEDNAKRWERLTENWESPVIFTTMVQFLETLFGSGTRSARRMHNLANSIIIFDEIQTLPVRCLHMFCNTVNFLTDTCGATTVLCTATQPQLGNVPRPQLGSLHLDPQRELINDVDTLFSSLRRTDFFDHCSQDMKAEDVATLALSELRRSGSCLVVCNTKGWAKTIYELCKKEWDGTIYYLSTNLCPAHRLKKIDAMCAQLGKPPPVLCISTQLIECGVDISFGSVIRLATGLDSILQAAGRCNRHGDPVKGRVHIVKVDDNKSIELLDDIRAGKGIFLDMRPSHLSEMEKLTNPDIITEYFKRYFHRRSDVMSYAVTNSERNDTLLNMLGSNSNVCNKEHCLKLQQSFASAAKLFQAIDAPTETVIVPYGKEGNAIIADLCSTDIFHRRKELLRMSQRYSVNLYKNTITMLRKENALHDIQQSGILSLREEFYCEDFGIVTEPVNSPATLYFGEEDK